MPFSRCFIAAAVLVFYGHSTLFRSFGRGQFTYPHCFWSSLLGILLVLSAHSFASCNWQLPFFNQRKGENGRRNYFTTNLHERLLPDVRFWGALLLLCWCFTALRHCSGHFERGQLTYPHCSWASLLGSLPVFSAHSFASNNWQLPFLNQRKGENGRRNDFTTNLQERLLPDLRFRGALLLLCWCFTALRQCLGHFERGQLTYPHCSWASLLGSLPVLSAHSFASCNWQLPFLNQRLGESGRIELIISRPISTKDCCRTWVFEVWTMFTANLIPG